MLLCLTEMREAEDAENYEDAEIVCEGIRCWLGDCQVSYSTVQGLLRLVLVSDTSDSGVHRYTINDTGRGVLLRPELAAEVERVLAAGGAFSITATGHLEAI